MNPITIFILFITRESSGPKNAGWTTSRDSKGGLESEHPAECEDPPGQWVNLPEAESFLLLVHP